MARVSIDDLLFAEDWLANGYEAADDDDNGPAAQRVAAWIRAEIERREEDAQVRTLLARTDGRGTKAQARDALRRAKVSHDHR